MIDINIISNVFNAISSFAKTKIFMYSIHLNKNVEHVDPLMVFTAAQTQKRWTKIEGKFIHNGAIEFERTQHTTEKKKKMMMIQKSRENTCL